jgi:hypothetical protein
LVDGISLQNNLPRFWWGLDGLNLRFFRVTSHLLHDTRRQKCPIHLLSVFWRSSYKNDVIVYSPINADKFEFLLSSHPNQHLSLLTKWLARGLRIFWWRRLGIQWHGLFKQLLYKPEDLVAIQDKGIAAVLITSYR